jgi:hypothetical protein
VVIQLPAGFVVDEIPEPVKIDSPYGVYHASWKTGDEKGSNQSVTFEQSLEVREMIATPAEYTKIKDFFDRVLGSQSAPVILLKH